MQAVAYRENIVPIRAKSIFLLQKLELRKSDSNHFKKVFAKWKFADFRRFAADRLYSRQRFRFTASGLRLGVYGLGFTGRKRHAVCGPPVYCLFTGKNDPKTSVFCP